jgi:hypothetical protein
MKAIAKMAVARGEEIIPRSCRLMSASQSLSLRGLL